MLNVMWLLGAAVRKKTTVDNMDLEEVQIR